MKIEELMSYIFEKRQSIELPSTLPPSVVPLMISESFLEEMVDGTELNVEQWMLAATAGVMLIPDGVDYYPPTWS
jgi:hypothetical protein